jgi:thiol-disulfide isomerase/thioredoxin
MKKLLLVSTLLLSMSSAKAQLALENFNSGTLPSGWVLISDGKTVNSTFTGVAAIRTALNAAAWTPYEIVATGNFSMITTSYFTPAGTADRWMITPSFTVTSANTVFKWQDYNLGSAEKNQVYISPTAGTTAASFTTKLYDAAASSGSLSTHAVSLAAYNGQTVRLAFREANTNIWGFIVDNVESSILPYSTEMALSAVNPSSNSVARYDLVGTPVTIQGYVTNNGSATLTSFTAKYQVGTSPVVSETKSVSVGPLATATFSFTTPASIPALGSTPVKVWVELTGDVVKTNDSLVTSLVGVAKKPLKKPFVEEGTGTWCGWCVRGTVYMDSLEKVYGNEISLSAVHNSTSDPMQNPIYDAFVSSKISGYPSALYDRAITGDPSSAFAFYNGYTSTVGFNIKGQKSNFGFADLGIKTTLSGTTLNARAYVKPAITLNGNFNLALVITEDGVTSSPITQKNYYSGSTTNILVSSLYNFNTLPADVPSPPLIFNAVARGIYPSATGAAGVLPSSITSGATYTYDFPAITLNSSWKTSKMKAILLFINSTDGTVLNSENVVLGNTAGTAIQEVASLGINTIDVYPNPATDVVTTKFSLTEQSNVAIEIVDMLGKVVKTVANKSLTAGTYEVPTNVAELASGIYLVKITTDNGSITERLSIAK